MVSLTGVDNQNYSSTLTLMLEVDSSPIADFFSLPRKKYINQPVIFNASNSYDPDGYITNYTWDFGDGTIEYGMVIEHSYSSSGEYNITLTVTDNENASSSYSKTILIDIIPPETVKTVGTPKYGSNDEWVTSHTEFNLTATDDVSGVNKTYYRIWYNNVWTPWIEYRGNFTLTGEGKHYLEYYSVDNAGSVEEVHNQTHYIINLTKFCLKLDEGWNLVSIPKMLDTPTTASVLFDLQPAEACFYYDTLNGRWVDASDTNVIPCRGYWVFKSSPYEICMNLMPPVGLMVPPQLQLYEGWNLIGYPDTLPRPVDDGTYNDFSSIAGLDTPDGGYKFEQILEWNGFGWSSYPPIGGLTELLPGHGYWIVMKEDAMMFGTV